jgi:hypothetical protein
MGSEHGLRCVVTLYGSRGCQDLPASDSELLAVADGGCAAADARASR